VAEPVKGVAAAGEKKQRPEKEEPQTMAEKQKNTPSSKGIRPAGDRLNPGPRKKGRQARKRPARTKEDKGLAEPVKGVAGEKEAPVTEKPVATTRKISQYVVSVDDGTGRIVKMEKQDEKTGERKEFSQQEYAAAYAFGSSAAPYYAASAASLYDPLSSPAVQAYLKTISDYWRAFAVIKR
jgi:hypothetical protein